MFPTRTKHVLKFAIVGGSIAGLSAAYCLRQAGHDVTVLEKNDIDVFVDRPFCGLRIPPNMTRLMRQHIPGARELFEEKTIITPGVIFRQGETFEVLGKMVFTGEIMESLQSQYYHIAYSDLWNHFYNLCKQCDVEFKFGFDVVEAQAGKVDLDPVTISSSSGEEVICDIVVGADGNHSTIRKLVEERERLVLGEESDVEGSSESKPSLAPWISCRISLPVARMQTDPGLAELSREDWWNIWMFNGVAYNCGKEGPDQYVLNIFCDHPRYANLQETDWSEETTSEVPELLKRVAEPQLQKIIELASSFQVTKQASRVLHRYTDKCNQVVIIGAAAHACMINGTFNSAIAIEDAFTLGYLFSRMSARNEIPYLLHGLGEIRQRHTEIVKASDSDVLHLLCMPPGPEQEARDALFKQTHREDSENEETLEFMWSSYITQFDYDAKEAVEEWWLNWMKPIENSR